MQEALKNLEAAKDAASPEKIAEIDTKIAIFQENYDTNLAQAAIYKESLGGARRRGVRASRGPSLQ
ncbi:hypothetical protein, partial [Collinsella sp. AF19-7AC]